MAGSIRKECTPSITLRNLYGTPATDRRIKSRVSSRRANFHFAEFKDYSFYDPLRDEKGTSRKKRVDLGEQTTDAEGKAPSRSATRALRRRDLRDDVLRGRLRSEGGRSVHADNSSSSPRLPYVVGYKADGDSNYINAETARTVDLIAVDPASKKSRLENVQLDLIEQSYVSSWRRRTTAITPTNPS